MRKKGYLKAKETNFRKLATTTFEITVNMCGTFWILVMMRYLNILRFIRNIYRILFLMKFQNSSKKSVA